MSEKLENKSSGKSVTFQKKHSTHQIEEEDKENHNFKQNLEKLQLQKENAELRQSLQETEEKVDTLMETVILMEKRITLLEDQMRLSHSLSLTEK